MLMPLFSTPCLLRTVLHRRQQFPLLSDFSSESCNGGTVFFFRFRGLGIGFSWQSEAGLVGGGGSVPFAVHSFLEPLPICCDSGLGSLCEVKSDGLEREKTTAISKMGLIVISAL